MTNLKKLTVAMAFVVTVCAYLPQDASADGPLRRWWRNVTGRNNTTADNCGCRTQQTALSPAVAANPNNLQPGQCMRTCQKTCSRTVVNYVPQTAYRTSYKRVPVTQYRPVTNSDPCTGCTVTCMKPCTSYTYQVQRVPYTTYRPVYRTQTYKVPVTTITNDCATGTCGTCPTVANFAAPQTGCNTCGSGTVAPAQNFGSPGSGTQGSGTQGSGSRNFSPLSQQAPTPAASTQTFLVDPSSSLSTQGSFNPAPADQQPVLNGIVNPQTSQRPVQFDPSNRTNGFNVSSPVPAFEQLRQPAVINFDGHTAKNPVRRSWDYTPVRFASAGLPTERRVSAYAGTVAVEAAPKKTRKSRWVEVE